MNTMAHDLEGILLSADLRYQENAYNPSFEYAAALLDLSTRAYRKRKTMFQSAHGVHVIMDGEIFPLDINLYPEIIKMFETRATRMLMDVAKRHSEMAAADADAEAEVV